MQTYIAHGHDWLVCCAQSVLCGRPAALTVHTADAFGNVCTTGGNDVAFVHQAAGGSKAYKVCHTKGFCFLSRIRFSSLLFPFSGHQ